MLVEMEERPAVGGLLVGSTGEYSVLELDLELQAARNINNPSRKTARKDVIIFLLTQR